MRFDYYRLSRRVERPTSHDEAGEPVQSPASAARRCYHLLRRTPLAFVLRSRPAQRLRTRILSLDVEDVHEVLDALDQAGISAWLAGGWGTDALLGTVTRRHSDLDVVVDSEDELAAERALARRGFASVELRAAAGQWMPTLQVLRDGRGRTVDLLPVALRTPTTPTDGPPAALRRPDAFASGRLGGRRVACLSPALQVLVHQGYEPTATDVHDVGLLCERFGIEVPQEYTAKLASAPPPRVRGLQRRARPRVAP